MKKVFLKLSPRLFMVLFLFSLLSLSLVSFSFTPSVFAATTDSRSELVERGNKLIDGRITDLQTLISETIDKKFFFDHRFAFHHDQLTSEAQGYIEKLQKVRGMINDERSSVTDIREAIQSIFHDNRIYKVFFPRVEYFLFSDGALDMENFLRTRANNPKYSVVRMQEFIDTLYNRDEVKSFILIRVKDELEKQKILLDSVYTNAHILADTANMFTPEAYEKDYAKIDQQNELMKKLHVTIAGAIWDAQTYGFDILQDVDALGYKHW